MAKNRFPCTKNVELFSVVRHRTCTVKIYHALATFEEQQNEMFRSFIAEKQDLFNQYGESSKHLFNLAK